MNEFMNECKPLRHIMAHDELLDTYRKLDNFLADCTEQEAEENREAFIKIKTLLHQRMRKA